MSHLAMQWGHLHYRLDGVSDDPVLVLCNSLGTDLSMWDPVVPLLVSQFRVLRFDGRGQGHSSVPDGPYSMRELGGDVCDLLDALSLERVLFCGQAFGSLVGVSLALHAPQRLDALVLANSSARIGSREFWDTRIKAVRTQGLDTTATAITGRWFSPGFAEANPNVVADSRRMLLRGSTSGYIACCAALRDADFGEELAAIDLPVLLIAGIHDAACPPEEARRMAARIAGARYREMDTGHLSPMEDPRTFAAALLEFLSQWRPRVDGPN